MTLELRKDGAASYNFYKSDEFGRWTTKRIGEMPCIVLKSADEYRVYILRPDGAAYRVWSVAETFSEAREDALAGVGEDPEISKGLLVRVKTDVDSDFGERVQKKLARMNRVKPQVSVDGQEVGQVALASREKRDARRRFSEEFQNAIMADPDCVLTVALKYPSPEEAAKVKRIDFAYTEEMQELEFAFVNSKVVFKEETLRKFIDRCDWGPNKGLALVACAASRPELSADSCRELASKFIDLIGVVDPMFLIPFFANPNTPVDSLEAALRHPKINSELKSELVKCLERSKSK